MDTVAEIREKLTEDFFNMWLDAGFDMLKNTKANLISRSVMQVEGVISVNIQFNTKGIEGLILDDLVEAVIKGGDKENLLATLDILKEADKKVEKIHEA